MKICAIIMTDKIVLKTTHKFLQKYLFHGDVPAQVPLMYGTNVGTFQIQMTEGGIQTQPQEPVQTSTPAVKRMDSQNLPATPI